MANDLQITTLPALQDHVALCCAATSDAEREVTDELTRQFVRYCDCHRPRTDREAKRALRKVRRRAKVQLIGGGILESIALSILGSLIWRGVEILWRWWSGDAQNQIAVSSMATGLAGWSAEDEAAAEAGGELGSVENPESEKDD